MTNNTKEIFETYNKLGSYAASARELGIDPKTVRRHVEKFHSENSFMASEANRTGIPTSRVGHYWLKTRNEEGDDVSIFVKNQQEIMEYEELRDKLTEDLKQFSPYIPKIERREIGDNLLVIDPADVHIGKLGVYNETGHDNYGIDIAFERVVDGVADLIQKAKPFGIAQVAIIVGNDILHIDNTKRTTTGGTPQDTDGQWWEMFEAARDMYVTITEMAKELADVTLVFCPSNHDKVLGFGVMDSLFSWYRNDENVSVSNYGKSMRHRKYIQFGNNLIGITHGDGAKNKDLTSLMQFEAREAWANTRYAYWYVHHLHHKYRIIDNEEVEKDYNGVSVIGKTSRVNRSRQSSQIECIRSPSAPDSWHSQNGFVSMSAIEAFIHDPQHGQIARLTSYV